MTARRLAQSLAALVSVLGARLRSIDVRPDAMDVRDRHPYEKTSAELKAAVAAGKW